MNEQEIYRVMVKAYEKYAKNTYEIYDKAIDDNEMKELLEKLSEGVKSQYTDIKHTNRG